MDIDFNNTEFRLYSLLSEWIASLDRQKIDFNTKLMPLISAFFSSSSAFNAVLERIDGFTIPDEITELSEKWKLEEISNAIRVALNIQYGTNALMTDEEIKHRIKNTRETAFMRMLLKAREFCDEILK